MPTLITSDVPFNKAPIESSDVNTPLAQIKAVVNNLDSTNFADAAVTTPKIADGSVTSAKLSLDWQDWTPTYTNLNNVSGTIIARYVQVGKTVHFKWLFRINDLGAVDNAFTVSLPVDAAADYGALTHLAPIGSATARDTGTALYTGLTILNNPTTATVYWSTGTVGQLTQVIPFTEAVGDFISISGTYESI